MRGWGWLWAVPVCFGLYTYSAVADEPFFATERASSVLNAPSLAVGAGKAVTNLTQPGVESLYDFGGEWRYGTSMSLWTWKSEEMPLLSIRSGYVADYLPYLSAPVDLKGVTTRYLLPLLPDPVEGWLAAGPLDLVWSAVGKYGLVGPWVGFNFDQEEDGNDKDGGLVGGVSLGIKVSF